MSRNANKLTMDRLPKGFMGQIFVLILILIAIVIVTYSLIRFFIDQYNYQKGHQAFIRSNCVEAIPRYDNILHGRRLMDLGEFIALAQQEKTECLRFLEAIEKQQNQEYGAALLAYMDFIKDFRSSKLANDVRNRTSSLFGLATPSDLASQESCSNLRFLINENLIEQQEINLPPLYLACGQVYDSMSMFEESYRMYEAYLTDYPAHSLAQTVEVNLLSNPIACESIESLKGNSVISSRPDFVPRLYYNCGQMYDNANKYRESYTIYETSLMDYPSHSLAQEVETKLLSNPNACENVNTLKSNSVISSRPDFVPKLYYNCGHLHESEESWADAIEMYESFLADYPGHPLSTEVSAALARSMVAQAGEQSAGEIPPPERSGSTGSNLTQVIIQNDSPSRLRIVFSGPEARIEELDACSSCTKYSGIGPIFCPNKGPIGTYPLQPGEYDIVVESISEDSVTPWTGKWTLDSGSSYDNCFFIVTTFSP